MKSFRFFLLVAGVLGLFALFLARGVNAQEGEGAGPSPCDAAPTLYSLDTNADQAVDLSDFIYGLTWFFSGGQEPQVCLADPGALAQAQADLAQAQADLAQAQAALAACQAQPESICNDALDNDGDGDTDCDDSDCDEDPICIVESTLVATGWTQCHDETNAADPTCANTACPGQDAVYQNGCPMVGRFTDNMDGTVTDTCTNLMWQKDGADTTGDGTVDAADAADFCGALNHCESLSFAGQDDWRLPNVRELNSLADLDGNWPSTIAAEFSVLAGNYWSSTNLDANTAQIGIYSNDFRVAAGGKASPANVRAVRDAGLGTGVHPPATSTPGGGRGGTCFDETNAADAACTNAGCPGQDAVYNAGCPATGRYVDNMDGTVTDTCTGLIWQQDADTNGDMATDGSDRMLWCDALTHCEGLTLAGNDDWRLPNIHELESIMDYGTAAPAWNAVWGANPTGVGAHEVTFWSSSTGGVITSHALQGTFYLGGLAIGAKAGPAQFVRAVRGP